MVPAKRPSGPPPVLGAPTPGESRSPPARTVAAASPPRPPDPAPWAALPPPPPPADLPPPPPDEPIDLFALESPDFFAEVELLAASLDSLDYLQFLGLTETAGPREVKEAYHRVSRRFHPDRFTRIPDAQLGEKIGRVFRRVTEAYVVLRDEHKRAKYLADVAGPDREKKLRYSEASDAEQRAEAKRLALEEIGTTPKGRECFKTGTAELEAGRFEAAMRQFKMALMYEPANASYKERLKESEAAWERARPKDDFRIK